MRTCQQKLLIWNVTFLAGNCQNLIIIFLFPPQWNTLTKWLMTKVWWLNLSFLFPSLNQSCLLEMSVIILYSAFHLVHTPDEADTGVTINLVNEVLLGWGQVSDREDVNFLERKLFCLYSEGPIKMSSFFVWNKFFVSVWTSE